MYGPGDPQTMSRDARDYLEGSYDSDREVARQEWQTLVNAWEDGVSDVDPGEFEF